MAFTRSWSETQPDGSEQASDIDLEIRKLKTDIRERLDDITSFGSNTEPLELEATAVESAAPTFYGVYDDANAAGSKVTSEGRGKLLFIHVSATTDANGIVLVDLTEFTETFDIVVGNILHVASGSTGTTPSIAMVTSTDVTNDRIGVTLYDDTGGVVASTAVTFVVAVLVA